METPKYHRLQVGELIDLCTLRGIECKYKKGEMISNLERDDSGKYVRDTTCEPFEKDKFIIGVDPRNHELLVKFGKLVETFELKDISTFFDNRLHFISKKHIKDLILK